MGQVISASRSQRPATGRGEERWPEFAHDSLLVFVACVVPISSPPGREFEHRATAKRARAVRIKDSTSGCRAVKVAVSILDQTSVGQHPIAAVERGAEVV